MINLHRLYTLKKKNIDLGIQVLNAQSKSTDEIRAKLMVKYSEARHLIEQLTQTQALPDGMRFDDYGRLIDLNFLILTRLLTNIDGLIDIYSKTRNNILLKARSNLFEPISLLTNPFKSLDPLNTLEAEYGLSIFSSPSLQDLKDLEDAFEASVKEIADIQSAIKWYVLTPLKVSFVVFYYLFFIALAALGIGLLHYGLYITGIALMLSLVIPILDYNSVGSRKEWMDTLDKSIMKTADIVLEGKDQNLFEELDRLIQSREADVAHEAYIKEHATIILK